MKKVEKSQRSPVGTIAVHTIYGVASTLLLLLLMFLFAIFVANEVLPEAFINFAGVLSVFIASLISGYFVVKTLGHALFTSVLQGVFNIVVCYFMGMIIFTRIIPQSFDPYYLIAYMVGSVIGGILSVSIRPKRHKIKNKQRRM